MNTPHDCIFHWIPDYAQERGWQCVACDAKPGEPPGFSPTHDRELIYRKVESVLTTLSGVDVVYVSNGTHGDDIVANVVARCLAEDAYDQGSIARFILEHMTRGHAKYWRDVSNGILAGNDPRDRCACGALSTSTSIGGPSKAPVYRCSACLQKAGPF